MKKAFTLVEVMIILVIVGLLAAMAIPAYVKVKVNNIAKQVYIGNTVSREDYQYLQQNIEMVNEEYRSKKRPVEIERQTMPEPMTPETIVINGKKFKLVPE